MLLQSDRLEAAVASSELRYAIKIAVRQGRDKMQAEPLPPPPPPFLPLSCYRASQRPAESFGQVQRTLLRR